MPDSDVHAIAGSAAGVAAMRGCSKVMNSDLSLFEIAVTLGAAVFGSRAPDLIEPSDGPDHRGFFHSYIGGSLMAAGAMKLVSDLRKEIEEFETLFLRFRENGRMIPTEDLSLYRVLRWIVCLVVGFSYGYASHLVLDGMTPKSLPLLGN